MEKQIAAARADEGAMAAIRADPQILEEHLAVEATVTPHAPTPRHSWLL